MELKKSELFIGDWRDHAACGRKDPELFFPAGDDSYMPDDMIEKAKEVCQGCKVMQQCLDYAIETAQDFGVWGGMTESERKAEIRRIRKQRRRAQLATQALRSFS